MFVHMYNYEGQKSSAAILSVKRPAGVTPEVNLRIIQVTKHPSNVSTMTLKHGADVT